ncbi:tRNA-queuosine alpha-mannosyltransferase domain-containing protein [Aliikangiella sp. IMCC44359]|uniref:tRNA-queuosine alpha-mannosyltransferase domain-containing protein n=1 Tax=Aliikangiella sp. IMCC44359 TaxID=3459125 RepID=UPI00403B111C
MKPKVLLLSGYDAASHCYWREQLCTSLTQFDWTQLALPPRHFAWRTRGSSLTFAFEHKKTLQQKYDLIIATSMVDLASLRGFVPTLTNIPTILYFHENQFVYPVSNHQPNILNAQLTSIYSALCADRLIFNSNYNLKTFFKGAEKLLKRMPDGVPDNLLVAAKQRASILPVPINIKPAPQKNNIMLSKNRVTQIVWNHRWEYDKQPQVFFDAMVMLKEEGYPIKLHVLGQSFRNVPEVFYEAKNMLSAEIKTWGFQERSQYESILQQSDLIISTALHDFQGLSLLEGITKGCMPIAPKRVVYPDYLSQPYLYPVATDTEVEARNLYFHIKDCIQRQYFAVPNISQYYADKCLLDYAIFIETMLKKRELNENCFS